MSPSGRRRPAPHAPHRNPRAARPAPAHPRRASLRARRARRCHRCCRSSSPVLVASWAPGHRGPVEDDLVDKARRGDAQALQNLLVAEEPRLYAFGLRMCGDPEDARDVMQDTMLAVAKNIGSFRGEASLSTWMFQLARHACQRHRRRPSGAPPALDALDEATVDPSPDPERRAEAAEVAAHVQRALDALSPTHREVLVLRDVEGLTAPEVASVLGIDVGAVKSRLHRARAALREALAGPELPATPSCPDVLARWSERLEGELSPTLCAEIERHVTSCPRCSALCHSLEHSLAECKTLPPVPSEASARVRDALLGALALPRSS
ncbi:MAG: sigma-70 family RNA polymerase sigma factor [Deltaproteobacteria bacterium]|nr:sigma-70 family RNA polymerase sigma factor [Deltaproteobacteria bacterium]